MKATCTFSVALLIQFIGHCSSMDDHHLAINKAPTSLQRVLSITDFPEIRAENVQLTEYKNGEMIEFQQQDFDDLRERALNSNTKFEDDQFLVDPLKGSLIQYLRPTEIVDDPVFFLQQNNTHFYVRQGGLGDCWFIVGLVHLQYYPNLFKFIVRPYEQTFDVNTYAGIFHFRFWQAGTWVDVVIDDRLPTEQKKLVYASSGYPNEFWPALIEKAYAKLLYRSYEKLQGGFSAISMQDFSGGISETHPVRLDRPNILFEIIYHAKTRLTMIGASTNNETDTSQFGLLLDHAYAITDVKKVTGINVNHEFNLLHMYDPHGESSERYFGDIEALFSEETISSQLNIKVDGESWILYDDFIKYFEYVEICNLIPNSIIGDVYTNSGAKKLSLSEITGKFMGRINFEEITDDFIDIHPQYRVVLTEPDHENIECSILIGVSLKRRHDLQQVSQTKIYFHIISIDDDEIIRTTSSSLCGEKCQGKGLFAGKGQVSARLDVKPGTYYIIPAVKETIKGATFHLQILSEHANILEVYDRDINMPQINKKIHTVTLEKFVETDERLFFDMAITTEHKNKKKGMINFKGLYNILKDEKFSLNKNCHIAQALDRTVVLELELLSTNELVPQRKLSYLTIAKTLLITQEAFEIYGEKDFPGYIKTDFIFTVLRQNGYSINMHIFHVISAHFGNDNGLIHFNDFILIVFAIKNKIGSYCEEFSGKLCQDLVLMVNGGITQFKNFNEPEIHSFLIDINHFQLIIQFISKLKEIFKTHASASYFSVSIEKIRKLLDNIDYELTYDIIATIFHRHGNDVDIFYNQFVQAVVDVTLIFDKIQNTPAVSHESGINLNKEYHDMFSQLWKKKQEKKISIDNKGKK